MKIFLKCLFGLIFVFMVVMTARTALLEPLFISGSISPGVRAQFNGSPWAVATLYDAYFGFITFFCWVAYRECSNLSRGIWFLLIMALGNIAMSAYVLIQLFNLRPSEGLSALFRRKEI